jgi:hypothetical protein
VVDIGVSPAAPAGSDLAEFPVFTHRVFFSLAPEEEYRFSLPVEAEELAVILQGEHDTAQIKLKVK